MLTIILLIILAAIVFVAVSLKKLSILHTEGKGYAKKYIINFRSIAVILVLVIAILFQPFSYERIDAGSVGLKENFIGQNRGIQGVELVSGYQIYNVYTSNIHEIPLDQKTVHYAPFNIILKGGLPATIAPSFNYKVKPENADALFVELRQAFKNGGLKGIESNWMNVIMQSGINNVGNRFEVDSVFNYKELFDTQINVELTKKLSKWFEIDEFKSNIIPPASLTKIIEAKIKSIQEAQTFELDAIKAESKAKELKATAEGAYEAELINNKTKKLKAEPAVLSVYKAETERIWAQKGVSPYGNGNVFGSSSGLILNRK